MKKGSELLLLVKSTINSSDPFPLCRGKVLWLSSGRGRRGPRLPVGSSGFIETHSSLHGSWPATLVLSLRQFQGFAGRLHGFGKPPRLGIGGRQRAEDRRLLTAGESYRPPGEFHRLRAVADRGVRVGRQHPGGIVQQGKVVGTRTQQLTLLGQRLENACPLRTGRWQGCREPVA